MKWNNERGYLTFQTSLQGIKNSLNISAIDIVERCELMPYYTYIFKYLNERLVLLGTDVTIKEKIQEIFDIFDNGTSKIISNSTLDLAWELGIETTDYYDEGTDLPYNQEYLVFSWSNALTALCIRLKFQYSHLLYQSSNSNNCHCCCNGGSIGPTTNDIESWTSGIYPEDEEYSGDNTNSSWRTGADTIECTKCYR